MDYNKLKENAKRIVHMGFLSALMARAIAIRLRVVLWQKNNTGNWKCGDAKTSWECGLMFKSKCNKDMGKKQCKKKKLKKACKKLGCKYKANACRGRWECSYGKNNCEKKGCKWNNIKQKCGGVKRSNPNPGSMRNRGGIFEKEETKDNEGGIFKRGGTE